jgi:hypothetical protein
VAKRAPQEIRTDTTVSTVARTDETVAQLPKGPINSLTTRIRANLTTGRLFSFVLQSNHSIPTVTLIVSPSHPIRDNIPSWTFSVLGMAHGLTSTVTALLEHTQPGQEYQDRQILHHTTEQSRESHRYDKENNPDLVNRNAQRQLSTPNKGRTSKPIPRSPTRRSTRLQMRRAQNTTSQAADRQRGGRFTFKPTLPFDPIEQNRPLEAAQVYTLLQITGIDMNGQVQHMVEEALKDGGHETRATTPTHTTVPPRMVGSGMV